jgi:hypothetical protein
MLTAAKGTTTTTKGFGADFKFNSFTTNKM